jgi:outer membrane protein OmpA-like peptidoglycan-associated protein
MLHVQCPVGNQTTLRRLQTDAEELKPGSVGAASFRSRHDFSRVPIHPPATEAIREKPGIDSPRDQYKPEAERVAEQVMRMPEPQLQRKCACGGTCADCQKEHEDQPLQMKRVGGNNLGGTEAPPLVHEVLLSPGQPLDAATRAVMEPRFGHDFSKVRVHTDTRANESAHAVNALAYTVGPQIVFGAGHYRPGTMTGRQLLAHELTHVVQQQSRPSAGHSLRVGPSSDAYEAEAERAASTATSHGAPHTTEHAPEAIQRKEADPPAAAAPPSAGHGTGTVGSSAVPKPETCKAPLDMDKACSATKDSVTGVAETIEFVVDRYDLDHTFGTGRLLIRAAADKWRAVGSSGKIRVDGYASAEYECEYNWRLSCNRAKTIRDELKKLGVPESNIQVFAHGESDEAGTTLAPNRRAIISFPSAPPPPPPPPKKEEPKPEEKNKCGPDITSALGTTLANVGSYFDSLSSWEKRRSCAALTGDAPLFGVNPIMAWDTEELYLPNTWWLDGYFRSGCGSPRDPGCENDSSRSLCETPNTCGNTVLVGGKCMLAGTANYALYGKMYSLCADEFLMYFRFQMRNLIRLYKLVGGDDSGPPLAMATAAFDGDYPSIPSAAANRGDCTGRCDSAARVAFRFIWEPYHSR